MYQLASEYIAAKNVIEDSHQWVTLLKIPFSSAPADILRLATSNVDISWNGETWTAYPFFVDTISEGTKNEVQRVAIRVSNINQMAHYLAETYDGGVGKIVDFYTVYTGALSVVTDIPTASFEIINCSIDHNNVSFTLGAESMYQIRDPRRRMFKNFCGYKFHNDVDARCPYTGVAYTECNHTLSNCKVRNPVDSKFCGIFPMIGKNRLYV